MISKSSARQTLEQLSKEKAQLVELLVSKRKGARELKAVHRVADAVSSRLPSAGAQRRLWFIDRLEGGSTAYHIPIALRLRGNWQVDALQSALDALVQRHEVLRTVFVEADGVPVQEIARHGRFAMDVHELRLQPPALRDAEIARHSRSFAAAPFDLGKGPLLRGRLLQLADDEALLLITFHHIVADGWSIGVLVDDLTALYEAASSGREDGLRPLPVQFGDFVHWQQQWLEGSEFRRQLAYWQDHLQGGPSLLELPTDRPRPAVQSYRGATLEFDLGAALTTELQALANATSQTLAMIVYAGWSVVLSRLSGQQDIVIGMPVANRRRTELEGLIGLFVNTLAVRVKLDDDPSVTQLLQRTKAVMLGAYAHQELPFEHVVEALQPARTLSQSPIFQVMLVFQNTPPAALRSGERSIAAEEVIVETSQFDLTLSLRDSPQGLRGTAEYATDLFDASTVQRWLGHLREILAAMIRTPALPISKLQLMPSSERHEVLEVFNATETAYGENLLVHQLFEAQVARTPDATALLYENESLSYRQLNHKANQLARYLVARGIGPDQLVGLCIERSLEMVIGLFGILKAGAAYLPLDPNYPPDRLQYMLTDAAPRVLLTQVALRDKLQDASADIIALDADWDSIATQSGANLDRSALRSDQLAYVIYTSGSTGRPKGAMNEHRAVINRLQWMQQAYCLGERDRVLQKTPFSFDVSVWEYFWTLSSGATLVIARPQGHQDPDYLQRLIDEQAVTVLHFVPSMLQLFLEQLRAGSCGSLRQVVCSGEELSSALQSNCLRRLPHARLSNLYGPTEAAVDVTVWECSAEAPGQRVPIGRPIANVRMYVLDRHCQPVPVGVAGEVYIGGVQVGRGYWNRPQLTAERFIVDPFVASGSARLYKTGDLGRWRADGAIEYLGRNDYQVKIRGLRIELAEIEAQLAGHALVNEAAVLAREDVPGEKRLVAYVSHGEGEQPTAEELRQHLKSMLPEYMVPNAFVMLERMPLSPNGKLDRRALPAPGGDAYITRQYEAPQGRVEEIVAGVWQSLLRVAQIGRHDNFFALGGHSLLIVKMMERLRRVGLGAELRSVFESATLAHLAQVLGSTASQYAEVPANLIPMNCEAITPAMLPLVELEAEHIERIVQAVPGGSSNVQDIYPLAPLQEGILFHHLLGERSGDIYVLPLLLSLSSRQRLDGLIAAVQAVIDRHDVLRTAIRWEDLPRPLQVVQRQAQLPVQPVSLHETSALSEQLDEWVRPERQWIDIRTAPLLRLQVAQEPGTERWYALLQLHHITIDHVTLELITGEIVAHLQKRNIELLPTAPYRDHVARVLAYGRTHDAEAFFRQKLAGIDEPTAPFGLLDVRGNGTGVKEGHEPIGEALAQRVRTQARRVGVSPATLFHAAWALVVGHTSAKDDVVFGSVLLGRMHGQSLERQTLGMFINTLPLRIRLRGVTARELIDTTQRELVELLNHEQASLAIAQRCSAISGDAPLFTALLNYRHSIPSPESEWASAAGVEVLAIAERTNYPIAISVDELGDNFALVAQTDSRLDPLRVTTLLHQAVQSLTTALEQAPETPALALSIVSDSERQRVVQLFNETATEYPQHALTHELFERQVERAPQAVAVVYEGGQLSYAELNQRANQLAHYLRSEGVRIGDYLPVQMARGLPMLVAQLAALKCGSVYVPIDPELPVQRRAFMVHDCGARLVLTDGESQALAAADNVRWIDCVAAASGIASHPHTNLQLTMVPAPAAYVMYTSGSTGAPKGVIIPHRGVNKLVLNNLFTDIRPDDCIVHYSNPAFDASTFEVWATLLNGARMLLVSQPTVLEGERFAETLLKNQVTVLYMSVGLFNQYTDALADVFPRLRYLMVGGDSLDPVAVRRVLQHSPPRQLLNVYGPTECTTISTYHVIDGVAPDAASIPIGKPIANSQVYVLDAYRQPVPIGVVGELYIGGAGVANGYLNRPDLTAERFIQDPFGADPDARLYKTGDQARLGPDGVIEFLGRADQQVKLRGFRIELGEIEAQLLRHADIKETAVLAREDSPGQKRLVAYVVPREASVDTEALRAHLKASLPEYMVPGAFVTLPKLPLTSSGKLDRRALPKPELDAYVQRQYESPQGEVEEVLAGIWCSLLQVERVGRRDNFFELGGHSLLIVQMMERLRRVGLATEVRRVFDSPTLVDLAKALSNHDTAELPVPANLIPDGSTRITAEMLPLVTLEPEQVECVVRTVPGGAANIQDVYPLAPLQEGILFHHLLDRDAGDTYVLPMVLVAESRQRLEQLIGALQAVIDRHDVLRTAVLWEALPQPVQVVYRNASLPVVQVSLDPARDVHEQIEEWMLPERQRFDIRQAPLLRLQIAADLAGEQWYALLQMHHITIDHVAMDIVTSEVVAFLEGRGQSLPVSVPYRNHVAQTLARARTHDAEGFFRGKLGDVDEPTAPFGITDVHGGASRIEEARRSFDAELARRTRVQARRMGVSAATLFHAAWALVVARTAGRQDVVFGTLLLGRLQGSAGAQHVLGMFINTLPLHLRLQGMSAKGLVEQTQRELIELVSHEQASLAMAQRCSGLASSAPLFSTLLNYRHSAPDADAEWSEASGIRAVAGHSWTNYPLMLAVDDLGEGFALNVKADRRIDPRRIIDYASTAVQSLVTALEEEPQRPALALQILPEDERRQIIEQFNLQPAAAHEEMFHQLFEQQVLLDPHALAFAFAFDAASLTRAQLNEKANRLAWHLRSKGVGPDSRVALFVERGLEMAIGLLAILKAGGAYVPLDPVHPDERLAHMINDSAPVAVLTQATLRARIDVPSTTELMVLDLDAWHDSAWADAPSHNPPAQSVGLTPAHLAYVIYTSGSTGTPKGVMVEHRNLLYFLHAQEQRIHGLSPNCERVAWNSSIGFDMAVKAWGQLAMGRTVYLLSEAVRLNPEQLLEFLERHRIEAMECTPSHLRAMLAAGFLNGRATSLRKLLLGGEAIDEATWQLLAGAKQTSFFNMYGPTECSVDATCGPITGDVPNIGSVMPGARVYVLDERLAPMPIGVSGEIYIGGEGVARGYLNQPELTEARFVRDPFSDQPHARLYRTGDLAKWLADGTLAYLGRNDHQVKIRGFRIELGEIEARLAQQPGIKDAVVLAREDAPGEKTLIAYVVAQHGQQLVVEQLRAALKAALPHYMVPSAFVVLAELPLNANGKLDRRALPAPDVSAYATSDYQAPQGEFEEILAAIWQSLLRLERVGRHDNFFELGGHSLLIVQMMERLRRVGISVAVRSVFESRNLAQLAGALATGAEQFAAPPNLIPNDCVAITPQMLPLVSLDSSSIERIEQAVPGGARNIQDIYPLAPLQEGILFHHLLTESGSDTYVTRIVLSVASRTRLEQLVKAWQSVVDRHDVLRTAILWEQLPQPVQVVHRQASLALHEAEISGDTSHIEAWLTPERQRLDLRRAPLVQLHAAPAHDGGGLWHVLLQIHHIICDHVTLEAIVAEVMAHLEGDEAALPAPVPFRTHVAQARAYAATRSAETFFTGKLADVAEPTAPFDLLDVHGDGSEVADAQEPIEPSLAKRLRVQASRMGVSAATLFHAAWGLVVAGTTGKDDVVFGTVLLGRLQGNAGTQRTLGLFMNTLPLRLRLRHLSVKELVQSTQRELVELMAHEQASLAVAQQCSGVVGSSPLFSALLNYRHSASQNGAGLFDADGIEMINVAERTNYPIVVAVDDLGEGFELSAQTDRRIAPARLTGYLRVAVGALVEALESAPLTAALALPILSVQERHQVIESFNGEPVDFPRDLTIHRAFEQQVLRTAGAVAIVHDGQQLTYAQLNAKANQLARHLRARGIGPDSLVGICLERSVDMLVGLFGILKAGGAYVPLDPGYPIERLQYMVDDARPAVVISQAALHDEFAGIDAQWVLLDADWPLIAQHSGDDLPTAIEEMSSRSLAYVIYTSGSTGRPKGAMIEHQGVLSLARGLQGMYEPFSHCRNIGLNASLNFDASVQQLLQLLSGRTLHLVPEAARQDASLLLQFIEEQRIEVIDCTPSQLKTWLAAGLLDTRRHRPEIVLVGGEAIDPQMWSELTASPRITFYNVYGPTESTVEVTCARLAGDNHPPHIGKPMANRRIYILNAEGQPVPVGVRGEICVGGTGVGRGYLNRSELTAQRFIADPFGATSQDRIYRTGDVGRWRADGAIEYLGRNDGQVKIRGYRIELGEIEAQLASHPLVREAAVTVVESTPGDKRLVAYITSAGSEQASVDALREHLKEMLPSYMVPSAFVMMQRLPLTVGGKLDVRALPMPGLEAFATRLYEAPHGAAEATLADIWRDLLQIERVGRHDNFFELGGHSLHSMQLVTRIEERTGVRLSVISVFQHPTIEALGQVLQARAPASFADGDAQFEEGVIDDSYQAIQGAR